MRTPKKDLAADPSPQTSTINPFWGLPKTKLGWWAVGLAVANILLGIINTAVFMRVTFPESVNQNILPFYGIFMLACGLAAGIVGLIAILRSHEKSVLVWLTVVSGGFVLIFIAGEFLFPH